MNKQFFMFSAVAIGVTVIAAPSAQATVQFKDVKVTSSHGEAIYSLADRGIIGGYSDGTFKPGRNVTRAQAAKIIAKTLNIEPKFSTPLFTDVKPTDASYPYIQALVERGYLSGFSDGTFKPNEPIKRSHLSKILTNAFQLRAGETKIDFADIPKGNTYEPFIAALLGNGVTQGTSSSTYSPNNIITRGQLASFVYRAEKVLKQRQQVDVTIQQISGNKLTASNQTYIIPLEYQSWLNESNKAALTGAKLKGFMTNGELVIEHISITASSTAENPVRLNGTGAAAHFLGILSIETPYFVSNNLQFQQVNVTKKNRLLQINSNVKFMDVEQGASPVIIGNMVIDQLTVLSNEMVYFKNVGGAKVLYIPIDKAQVALGERAIVQQLVTAKSATIDQYIANYEVYLYLIKQMNGKNPNNLLPANHLDILTMSSPLTHIVNDQFIVMNSKEDKLSELIIFTENHFFANFDEQNYTHYTNERGVKYYAYKVPLNIVEEYHRTNYLHHQFNQNGKPNTGGASIYYDEEYVRSYVLNVLNKAMNQQLQGLSQQELYEFIASYVMYYSKREFYEVYTNETYMNAYLDHNGIHFTNVEEIKAYFTEKNNFVMEQLQAEQEEQIIYE